MKLISNLNKVQVTQDNLQVDQGDLMILKAIKEAKDELDKAEHYFNNVSDYKLVEYAIYMERAAKCRYDYYICEAKRRGIKVDDNIFYKINVG